MKLGGNKIKIVAMMLFCSWNPLFR